jgi:hypothetical protein
VPEHGGKIMGKLFDEIKAQTSSRSKMVNLKQTMKPDDYNDLMKAINDHTISASAISRTLKKHGIDFSVSALTAFRRAKK